jgi:hypothetical protein
MPPAACRNPRVGCGREREAKKIVALAVQRIASEHTSEISVSSVALPNDEMKGRIIGREGRNIRAFELATGVDVVIDDTPDTVVVSCFDPVRRDRDSRWKSSSPMAGSTRGDPKSSPSQKEVDRRS